MKLWSFLTVVVMLQLCFSDGVIMRRPLRRVVRRLDRSAQDILERVEESLEESHDRPRSSRSKRTEGRHRGRSRSRSRGGITEIARPLIRQALKARRGLLGNVGVQANLDNGKWNLNLKIGGRKINIDALDEGRKGIELGKDNLLGGEVLKLPQKDRLNFDWPTSNGVLPGHFGHNTPHVHAGNTIQSGWQPGHGYAASNQNADWLKKRSSEKDENSWSLESKETEIYTPLKEGTTTRKPKLQATPTKKQPQASRGILEYEDVSDEKSVRKPSNSSPVSKVSRVHTTTTGSPPVWTPKPWNSAQTNPPTIIVHTKNVAPNQAPAKWAIANASEEWINTLPRGNEEHMTGWTPIMKRKTSSESVSSKEE